MNFLLLLVSIHDAAYDNVTMIPTGHSLKQASGVNLIHRPKQYSTEQLARSNDLVITLSRTRPCRTKFSFLHSLPAQAASPRPHLQHQQVAVPSIA